MTKTGKIELHNYITWLYTIKKARNELDGACDLPIVKIRTYIIT